MENAAAHEDIHLQRLQQQKRMFLPSHVSFLWLAQICLEKFPHVAKPSASRHGMRKSLQSPLIGTLTRLFVIPVFELPPPATTKKPFLIFLTSKMGAARFAAEIAMASGGRLLSTWRLWHAVGHEDSGAAKASGGRRSGGASIRNACAFGTPNACTIEAGDGALADMNVHFISHSYEAAAFNICIGSHSCR